jgi:RimJ/RimL family protein N-acetyltransferase
MTLLDRHRTQIEAVGAGGIAVLETARLVLRKPRFEDAKQVAALAGDRRIAENTERIPHPYGIDDARQWISAAILQSGTYAITIGGEVIGACGLDVRSPRVPPQAGEDKMEAELGYWIGRPFWGYGYMTEAARRLIDHAFGDLGYKVLTAGARVNNPASRHVLEKCGFQWTGVGLRRIRAIAASVPVDRFRLERP